MPAGTGLALVTGPPWPTPPPAFDPFPGIADWVTERSGWLHVDGAFGLWALADPGRAELNDVVLNQVLVRLVDGPTTEALIAEIQADGRIWCGPTQWDGATAMRMSVCSWKTGPGDAALAADVILACAERVRACAV